MDSYNKEVIFHLPGLFRLTKIYEMLLRGYEENPGVFKDNVKIGSIYGSPTVIWNGGRLIANCCYPKDQLELICDFMDRYKIPARFTFTNCLLEEKHLLDTYGNLLLEIFNTGNNEIICNSEILENYIREKYGNRYKYISSTTKRLNNKEEQDKEVEKDYYLIVLDYDYNFNFEYLQSIQNKEKCELLCNPVCVPKCPYRKEHYKKLSALQLNPDPENVTHFCPYQRDTKTFFEIVNKENVIKPEDINKYLKMGFKHFKLEGRATSPLNVLDIITHYLIKDDYQNLVKSLVHEII